MRNLIASDCLSKKDKTHWRFPVVPFSRFVMWLQLMGIYFVLYYYNI